MVAGRGAPTVEAVACSSLRIGRFAASGHCRKSHRHGLLDLYQGRLVLGIRNVLRNGKDISSAVLRELRKFRRKQFDEVISINQWSRRRHNQVTRAQGPF